jgi:ribosomal-protein-alanine N-acetyltransferase
MILETERLRLRPLEDSDTETLFPILDDPEFLAHWDVPEIDDPDLVRAIVEGQVADMLAGKSFHWTVWTLDGAQFFGACDLSEIERRHKRAELGFLFSGGTSSPSYATEAIQAVISYAAAMGVRRLSARTLLGNLRSDALLEKLGFEEEGLLRGHVLRDGEHRDCRLFGLLL